MFKVPEHFDTILKESKRRVRANFRGDFLDEFAKSVVAIGDKQLEPTLLAVDCGQFR